jgi:translation initiation factor IF-2
MVFILQEYAALLAEKKKLYYGYHALKKNMQEFLVAKNKADKILGVKPEAENHDALRVQKQPHSHEK